MLPIFMSITVKEYISENGKSPFASWFNSIDNQTAAKVSTALTRIEMGNTSNVKSVGDGVLEYRIHFGPGIRIYFGMDGDTLVILLAGGTKRRQQNDISSAKERWRNYKQRKRNI